MSPAAVHLDPPAPRTAADRVTTTRRWAIGVLAVATGLVLAYGAFLVAVAWFLVSTWNPEAAHGSVAADLVSLGTDVAPALLVGWCTGLATCAALARGEALGPRASGLLAGAVGTTAGAAVLALTGLL